MPAASRLGIRRVLTHRWLSSSLFCSAVIAGFYSPTALSLDKDRLWLPTKYHAHYLKLKKAAELTEATDACAEVLRATIDLNESSATTPWYRILCRSEPTGSFTELVNGISFQSRSQERNTAPAETVQERLAREAEAAQQAQLEKQKAEQAAAEEQRSIAEAERKAAERDERLALAQEQEQQLRQQMLGEVCQAEILERTSKMLKLEWVTEAPVAELLDNGLMRFYAEFDAENSWGKPLQYQAVCTIATPAEFVVTLAPR